MIGTYRHREEAGQRLAKLLAHQGLGLVVGIPRGGVIVAQAVAQRLGRPLTATYARKLPAPQAPELAFGAMDEDAGAMLDSDIVRELGLTIAQIEEVVCHVSAEILRRQTAYGALPLVGAVLEGGALIVDDGFATGLTMSCAVRLLRRRGARRVVVAAPCGSGAAVRRLLAEADDVICPIVSESFDMVGDYYEEFEAVSDVRVAVLLGDAHVAAERARSADQPTNGHDRSGPKLPGGGGVLSD